MAFIPTPNAAKVVISYGTDAAEPISNSLWFTKPGFVASDLEALAVGIAAWHITDIMPLLSDDVSLFQVEAIDARTLGAPSFIEVPNPTPIGGVISPAGSLSSGVVVTIRTADRGRFARGRNYVRGFGEIDMGSRNVTPGTDTAVALAYEEILVTSPPSGWTAVVRSTQEDGVTQNPAKTRAVQSVEVRNARFGTQRRSIRRP